MAADGFLTRTLSRIRLFTDEPSINAKYTDDNLLDLIESSWADILQELNRNSSAPIVVRHDVSVSTDATLDGNTHLLPPTVGQVLRLSKVCSTTGRVEWEMMPRSRWNPAGHGIIVEGNTIQFTPYWDRGSYTLRLTYIPKGDLRLHEGTFDNSGDVAITNDTDANQAEVILASSPGTGTLDIRPNAYAGSVLRILGDVGGSPTADYVQERIIRSYDVTTRTATVAPALTYVPSGTTVPYEIAPLLGQALDIVVALDVAAQVIGIEGDAKRAASTERQYARKMRTLRLNAANLEAIVGQRFQHDTTHAERFIDW